MDLHAEAPTWELYNVVHDKGESKNLSKTNKEKLLELINRWNELNEQMQEPLFR
jgi:hypothetical protein